MAADQASARAATPEGKQRQRCHQRGARHRGLHPDEIGESPHRAEVHQQHPATGKAPAPGEDRHHGPDHGDIPSADGGQVREPSRAERAHGRLGHTAVVAGKDTRDERPGRSGHGALDPRDDPPHEPRAQPLPGRCFIPEHADLFHDNRPGGFGLSMRWSRTERAGESHHVTLRHALIARKLGDDERRYGRVERDGDTGVAWVAPGYVLDGPRELPGGDQRFRHGRRRYRRRPPEADPSRAEHQHQGHDGRPSRPEREHRETHGRGEGQGEPAGAQVPQQRPTQDRRTKQRPEHDQDSVVASPRSDSTMRAEMPRTASRSSSVTKGPCVVR